MYLKFRPNTSLLSELRSCLLTIGYLLDGVAFPLALEELRYRLQGMTGTQGVWLVLEHVSDRALTSIDPACRGSALVLNTLEGGACTLQAEDDSWWFHGLSLESAMIKASEQSTATCATSMGEMLSSWLYDSSPFMAREAKCSRFVIPEVNSDELSTGCTASFGSVFGIIVICFVLVRVGRLAAMRLLRSPWSVEIQ